MSGYGALSEEFARTLEEIKYGETTEKALVDMVNLKKLMIQLRIKAQEQQRVLEQQEQQEKPLLEAQFQRALVILEPEAVVRRQVVFHHRAVLLMDQDLRLKQQTSPVLTME